MSHFDESEWSLATLAVRAGQVRTAEGEQSEPIFPTSSFTFHSAAQAAARFSGREPGNIYSRFTNPTVRVFEERLAALEGGERCIATASGMSAILTLCMSLLQGGDHIVSSQNVFGTTVGLFSQILPKFGVTTTFVPLTDYDAWDSALTDATKIIFVETPANPTTEIADIERLAALARRHKCLLVVDNCFCTPALQQPLRLGADLVVHSATKYIDGQGRCVGGAIVGPRKLLDEQVFGFLRTAGPCLSPFNAWVFLKGLETLSIRMRAHCEHAHAVATGLFRHPRVLKVHYPGLDVHPQHDLAKRQQSGFGGIVAFEVEGGQAAAWKVIDATRIYSITANLGDTKSTITHPATTTHGRLTDAERERANVSPGLIRLSIGLENPQDLLNDLNSALNSL